MDENIKKTMMDLLTASLEGQLSADQAEQMNSLLKNHPQRIRFAVQYLQLVSRLKQSRIKDDSSELAGAACEDESFSEFIGLMAEYEKTAEEAEVECPAGNTEVKIHFNSEIKKVPVFRVNRFSLFVAVVSTAALFFMIAWAMWAPKTAGLQVGIVSDSVNAEWGNLRLMEKGSPLIVGDGSLLLEKGFAELLFDNGTRVVVEGPGRFEILAADKISVDFGRIYSIVSPDAMGFKVKTPSAMIVDMGTEFGVQVHIDGAMEAHVLKGKILLAAVRDRITKPTEELITGQARHVDFQSLNVQEIPIKEEKFARSINSKGKIIWRGQKSISLAGLISGGDGFGDVGNIGGINPGSGRVSAIQQIRNKTIDKTEYYPVSDVAFIDGVFVPDGDCGKGGQVISSANNTFDGFPATSGEYYCDISTDTTLDIEGFPSLPLYLGQPLSGEDISDRYIVMHTNAGITFDLNKIRTSVGLAELVSFKAMCGISDSTAVKTEVEFFVLLDGVLAFHYKVEQGKSLVKEIDIPLKTGQRFLTLVTTEGKDGKGYDCCLFKDPRIELKEKGR